MIRPATEADLDRLVEIHTVSYPDDRGAAARRLNFVQNALGRLEDLRVAERDGRVVGHAFGFDLASFFAGRAVPTLGIASVAVAPEARGTGIAAELLTGLEAEARGRGALLCILHAFRHGFYARRGYADVMPNVRLACDPRAVPAAWVKRARDAKLHGANDAKAVVAMYEAAALRSTGWLRRPETRWTRLFASERRQFVVLDASESRRPASGGSVDGGGYVSFETGQQEPHGKTRLYVHELVALDDEARRTLWGFLGMQVGQVVEIVIEVARDDAIAFALTDVDGARFGTEDVEHTLGRVVAGPMIRMLDTTKALAARGIDRSVLDGVVIDERVLASVAFGGLRLREAVQLDLAHGEPDAIARADAALAIPPFFTVDRF
jgi:predicted acetyltransferase